MCYPGLPGDAGHAAAARQMVNGFGGLMAFDVGHAEQHAKDFINALNVIVHAVSLGATESLICIPYLTTMLYLPEERRTSFGVARNTVRLSAGIEPIGRLIDDLDQALKKI
jgi:cystathionine beta-lyase/cystathionine gamma-synthase